MRYRVIQITTDDMARPSTVKETVEWEGDDTMELSQKYPKGDIHDTLGSVNIEDGWIHWRFRFERQAGDGWIECHDPRVRVHNPEHDDLEEAIDEENRRLFPGDCDVNWADDDSDDDEDCQDPIDDMQN